MMLLSQSARNRPVMTIIFDFSRVYRDQRPVLSHELKRQRDAVITMT